MMATIKFNRPTPLPAVIDPTAAKAMRDQIALENYRRARVTKKCVTTIGTEQRPSLIESGPGPDPEDEIPTPTSRADRIRNLLRMQRRKAEMAENARRAGDHVAAARFAKDAFEHGLNAALIARGKKTD